MLRAGSLILVLSLASRCLAQVSTEAYGTGSKGFVSFYQRHLAGARGITCPMYPSCSQYARLVFEKSGTLTAFFKTTDRLMRCGHDMDDYVKKIDNGEVYAHDPVDEERPKSYLQSYFAPVPHDSTFIDFLLGHKRYGEARLELWRQLHRGSANGPATYFTLAKTYFLERDYEGLFSFYSDNATAFSHSAFGDSVKMLLTKGYLYAGRYEAAALSTKTLSEPAGASDEALLLKGLTSLYLEKIPECERTMKSISHRSRFYAQAQPFLDIEAEFNRLPRRKPAAAFALSVVVPGSGYLVAGKKGTALSAFIINSLFALVAVEAFSKDQPALGATATVLGAGWYVGAMVGSYNATVKWNQRKRTDLIRQKTAQLNLY